MNNLDKQRLAGSFGERARTYARHADYQRILVRRLCAMLQSRAVTPRRWIDLGCGAGLLQDLLPLKLRPAAVGVGLDLSAGALHVMHERSPGFQPVCGDIETLPLRGRCADCVTISSTLQWTRRPAAVLRGAASLLEPDGVLVVGALVSSHLHEFIDSAIAAGIELPATFPSADNVLDWVRNSGVRILDQQRITEHREVPGPFWVIKRMSRIGAAPRRAARGTPGSLERLCALYRDRFPSGTGVRITYDLMILMAQRRS